MQKTLLYLWLDLWLRATLGVLSPAAAAADKARCRAKRQPRRRRQGSLKPGGSADSIRRRRGAPPRFL